MSLAHHIDVLWLREAFARTRKDGGIGIDGQTAADYREHLLENLKGLKERAKSGSARSVCSEGSHTETGQYRNQTDWHPDVRGQSTSASGRYGAGTDLRAKLPRIREVGS